MRVRLLVYRDFVVIALESKQTWAPLASKVSLKPKPKGSERGAQEK